jgi:hypothetical protein
MCDVGVPLCRIPADKIVAYTLLDALAFNAWVRIGSEKLKADGRCRLVLRMRVGCMGGVSVLSRSNGDFIVGKQDCRSGGAREEADMGIGLSVIWFEAEWQFSKLACNNGGVGGRLLRLSVKGKR